MQAHVSWQVYNQVVRGVNRMPHVPHGAGWWSSHNISKKYWRKYTDKIQGCYKVARVRTFPSPAAPGLRSFTGVNQWKGGVGHRLSWEIHVGKFSGENRKGVGNTRDPSVPCVSDTWSGTPANCHVITHFTHDVLTVGKPRVTVTLRAPCAENHSMFHCIDAVSL